MRIDPVHYCELEEDLSEKRRKSKSRSSEDVPAVRLKLFANTIKETQSLGRIVELLKLPYMTREVCQADLARAVSACPNLRHVDLPDGFFTGDSSCTTLRQEVRAHCPDIRKMRYREGNERSFQSLTKGHWQAIEVLELQHLKVDQETFRKVVSSLPALRELKITDMACFSDEVFKVVPQVPNFPALQSLIVDGCPYITEAGLDCYLERAETREALKRLSLTETGVLASDLPRVMWNSTHLRRLTFVASVCGSLPLEARRNLQSITLQTLYFEITSSEKSKSSESPKSTDSYYSYLLISLLSDSLPALRSLYVRDESFPNALLKASAQMSTDKNNKPSRGLSQPLDIYTKGLDEADWFLTTVTPSTEPGRPASSHRGRPLSAYSASQGLGPQWGSDNRVVGNGFGGFNSFLAIPAEDGGCTPRPASSKSKDRTPLGSPSLSIWKGAWPHRRANSTQEKRVSRTDLWR